MVLVVPGEEQNSSNFGGNVPDVMDTGQNMRASSQSLGYSWNANDAPNVKMYQYIGGTFEGKQLGPVSVSAPSMQMTSSSISIPAAPIRIKGIN